MAGDKGGNVQLLMTASALMERTDDLMQVAQKQYASASITPPPTPDLNLFDTRRLLLTERQRELVWYYQTFGIVGLCFWIYHIAIGEIQDEIRCERFTKIKSIAEKLLRQKQGKNGPEIQVKWKGYTMEDSTWESRAHLERDIPEMVAAFDKRFQGNLSHSSVSRTGQIYIKDSEESGSELDTDADDHHYDEVRENGHKSWRLVIRDFEQGSASRMLYSIASLPPEVIQALLYGNLPARMQDLAFFGTVGAWVECNNRAGTYGVFVAVRKTINSLRPWAAHYDGKNPAEGICVEHMLMILCNMKLYVNLEHKDSARLAQEIDKQMEPKAGDFDYAVQRKYGGSQGKDAFERLRECIDLLLEVYETVADEIRASGDLSALKAPLRCPVYMGLARNTGSRGPLHSSRPDSKLLGLFLSTTKYLYKDLYDTAAYTYQIFHSARRGDIGLQEIVSSILGSGFPWQGGLAYTHAGGYCKFKDVDLKLLQEAGEAIKSSGHIESNLADSEDKISRSLKELGSDDYESDRVADDDQSQRGHVFHNRQRIERLSAETQAFCTASYRFSTDADIEDMLEQYKESVQQHHRGGPCFA